MKRSTPTPDVTSPAAPSAKPSSRQPLPIGISDFPQLRREGRRYVDKTALIVDVLAASAQTLLLPRPRRFGKTLAMSTLAAYLRRPEPGEDRAARAALFEDLAVWRAGDHVRSHFARYPVLMLSFKDVKADTWADCLAGVTDLVAELCTKHVATVEDAIAGDHEREQWELIRRGKGNSTTLGRSLAHLSRWLHRATGEPCVILIDEYDAPLHSALERGYYDDAITLFRNLLSGAFKDNPHLFKGVLTGILHITKESIFSGLNNLAVYTLLSKSFSQHFGFTPDEVALLAREYGLAARLPEIERWYNGYNFGGQTIYNPWSVLRYINEPEMGPRPYWVNTASNALLRELLVDRDVVSHGDLETLLTGGTVRQLIDEHVVLRNLHRRADAVWGLLLFAGYLKAASLEREAGELTVELAVPNNEVRWALQRLFADFLLDGLGDASRVSELCQALLAGDGKTFGRLLGKLMQVTLSYHDVARPRPSRGGPAARDHEAVYHAFLLGLLTTLETTHHVRSNREAGYGRYDVMLLPRRAGEPGAVLELKVIDKDEGETVEQALDSAMAQLKDRDYAAELREQGADPVVEVAAVFDGKRAWVRVAGATGQRR